MKKLLAVLLLLVAVPAFADAKFLGPACSRNKAQNDTTACTQTANSAAGNEPTATTPGVSMANQCGVRVFVSAASGQTLSGGASAKIKFWVKSDLLARYVENRRVSIDISGTSGARDFMSEDLGSLVAYGLMYVEAESVTSSSGDLSVAVETISCRGSR